MKRRATKIFSVRLGKRLPVALMTMALAAANMAFAQEENPWVGEALPAEGGEFYLYNKSGDGFLLGANTWGTQGSLGQPGLLCTVVVSNGKYKIVTRCNGDNRGLGSDGYIDNGNPAEYTFTDPTPDDGLNEYVMNLDANKWFYYGGEGTVLNLDGNGSATDAQWLFVSKAQREQRLNQATKDNGVDATFYIMGASFVRTEPHNWKEVHNGGTVSLSSPRGASGNHFYCAEASNNDNFDIYQELTGIRNGRYRLTCQGFYRGDGSVRNAMLYAGLIESPLLLAESEEDVPTDANKAAIAFGDGRYGGNTVEVIVQDGTLRLGVKKNAHIKNDWVVFDNFRLTYLGEATAEEAFTELMGSFQNLINDFNDLGAEAIKSELQVVYDKYVGTTGDVTEALQVVSETVKSANAARALTMALNNAVKGAEAYWAKVENGEVTLNTALKTSLQQQISEAKKQLAETNMADMVVGAEESTTKLNAMVVSARNWAGLSYALGKAKALADRLGGLENTDEYKKVLADLDAVELTFDDAILDVAALKAKIQEKLTPEFLATVTEENKLDLTSFITNPNIFNNTGVKNQMPGGWILGRNDASDNTEWCTVTDGDGELHAGNWSGNKGNDVTGVHYYQKIGIGDGSVKLPDGLYQLAAATYSDGDPNKIVLYATSDSVNFDTVYFNRDRMLYDEALSKTDVTSTVEDVVVVGGQLYIGVRGSDPENNHQGGNGKNWYADNFRLYFAGKDVLGAYRGRLQDRLDKAVVLHDSLTVYGIDDSESYGFALDPEEGYYLFLTEGTLDDVSYAINDLDKMNADAEKLIANYLLLTPLVQNGNNFNNQLNEGVLFAQPTAKKTFIAALETAAEVAEDMTWDNYLSDAVVEQAEALKVATTEFMNSVALCFPMGTAKVLADQIGGLAQTEAYLNVMTYLASDELDPLDVDLAVQALQGECINAMTPEVLARATVDEPFDMTTFVVNPNIYQDATDDEGNPTDIRINGWTLETNADRAPRTGATSGDTWMYTTSHSSNDAHNISSATDYRQVIGTQPEVSAEGKYGLPTGAYRVEAATFLNHEWDKMRLYAQTNSVEVSTVTGSAGQDSTVYAYTEIEYADSAFNGKQDVWDAAQATLGTTTVVPEIYVENGAVTIGIRGNGRVGGNDSWFLADNFRLYYVGTERGSNIGGTMVDRNDNLSELVDVYDITGKLVRKQAKRADAVKGLKKGIYIAGGKKYVVTGN